MSEPADATDFSAAESNAAFVLALRERGVRDTAVLRAMELVARERFVPVRHREHARRDIALPLPCGQSMLAPTTIAAMLALLGLPPGARVLEVGTGSGFVTALLVQLGAARVLSLERYARLARTARATLGAGEAAAVETGDGLGEIGPPGAFDRVLVNGLCAHVPERLCAALAPNGRLVAGVATGQGPRLVVVERTGDGALTQRVARPAHLPPLTAGRAAAL